MRLRLDRWQLAFRLALVAAFAAPAFLAAGAARDTGDDDFFTTADDRAAPVAPGKPSLMDTMDAPLAPTAAPARAASPIARGRPPVSPDEATVRPPDLAPPQAPDAATKVSGRKDAKKAAVADARGRGDTPPAMPPGVQPPPENATPDEVLIRRQRAQGDVAAPLVPVVLPNDPEPPRPMDASAQPTAFGDDGFRPDPVYPLPYDAQQQLDIYGAKHAVSTPRPLVELGYPLYAGGALGKDVNLFGAKNPARPQLLVYGDFRSVYGYNRDGAVRNNLIANRINLDLDLKLTGTERLHALLRPLDHDGQFTRVDFNEKKTGETAKFTQELNAVPFDAYFEGDLGQIAQGITGRYYGLDVPIAMGLTPLLFQNGVWMDDQVDGFAITLPARNSKTLDISNFDITAFAGFDDVTTKAVGLNAGKLAQHAGKLFGVASFFERRTYYYEVDIAHLADQQKLGGFDHSYDNFSAAVTHRWKNWLSWSVRVVENFNQDKPPPGQQKTADGTLVLLENSFFTRQPYTLLPYLNLFYGEGHPQSAARDAGAGGILKNTGLNFETDNFTGFPKLDDTGQNSYGGAVGLEYLFSLDRQLVGEIAGLDRHGSDSGRGGEYAVGLRYQQPINRQWIIRTDGIVGQRTDGKDLSGVRLELRCKF